MLSRTRWKLLSFPAFYISNFFIFSSSQSRGIPPTKTLFGVSWTYVETIPRSTVSIVGITLLRGGAVD